MIKVLFEDTDLLVIDKPAGVIVNRADTTKGEITVQDWAEEKLGIKYEVSSIKNDNKDEGQNTKYSAEDTFYQRGGIVHRLDKETSGILLIAKTPEAFIELQTQFKERKVKKTYIALAHGLVSPAEGEINVPVGRLPWNRKQFGVVAGGKEARTTYKVLSSKYYVSAKEELSLLELYPETGRTHQIRVHLKYIGYPIFGDYLYAGRKTQKNDRKLLSRVFLHAAKISFFHPQTKELISFESSLPEELSSIVKE